MWDSSEHVRATGKNGAIFEALDSSGLVWIALDWSGSIHRGRAGGFIGVEKLLSFGQFYSVLVSSAAATERAVRLP